MNSKIERTKRHRMNLMLTLTLISSKVAVMAGYTGINFNDYNLDMILMRMTLQIFHTISSIIIANLSFWSAWLHVTEFQ